MRLLLLALLACTGTSKDDTAEPADTDTDSDTDADADSDTDTDTDPRSGVISGTVVQWDGAPAVDVSVEICSIVCRYARTDANGNFEQSGLEAHRFKIDAIGATYSVPGFGNSLVGVELAPGEVFAMTPAMVLPPIEGPIAVPETAGSDTYDLGQVSLTFAANTLDFVFGAVDNDTGTFNLSAGVLEGDAILSHWEVTPAFLVNFLPWITAPSALMDVEVTGLTSPDGTYDVYALQEYGQLEGPLGTATVTGGTATAAGIQPTVWTWLLFVPAA
jgi:hypothetical protein